MLDSHPYPVNEHEIEVNFHSCMNDSLVFKESNPVSVFLAEGQEDSWDREAYTHQLF
jgi:hypothetical protein